LLERRESKVRDGLLLEWCQGGNSQTCQSEKRGEELNLFQLPSYWELQTDRHAFIVYATGERELYDLSADPFEMTNLAGRPDLARLIERLGTQLDALRAPPPTPSTTIATGPPGDVAKDRVTFVFFSQARTTGFGCRLTGPGHSGGWTDCDEGWTPYRNLAPGAYTFSVRAVDAAGAMDPTPASRAFRVTP
jgi:hypothetical protein